jgi:hypothetical protein
LEATTLVRDPVAGVFLRFTVVGLSCRLGRFMLAESRLKHVRGWTTDQMAPRRAMQLPG